MGCPLALLWHIFVGGFCQGRVTVPTSPRRRPCDEIEDRVSDGRHGRLRWWTLDSFFSAPLPGGGGIGGRRRRSLSSGHVDATRSRIGLQSDRGHVPLLSCWCACSQTHLAFIAAASVLTAVSAGRFSTQRIFVRLSNAVHHRATPPRQACTVRDYRAFDVCGRQRPEPGRRRSGMSDHLSCPGAR